MPVFEQGYRPYTGALAQRSPLLTEDESLKVVSQDDSPIMVLISDSEWLALAKPSVSRTM